MRNRLKIPLLAAVLWLLVLSVVHEAPVRGQITIPNSFSVNTIADPDAVNANFTQLGTQGLNRTGGTMIGTLNAQTITPTADATYPLGDNAHRFTVGWFSGQVTAGMFSGPGTSLTALNASNLASGTVPNARLSFVPLATSTKTANYTAVAGDYVLASCASCTITLPLSTANANAEIDVKSWGTVPVLIGVTGADTIDGVTSLTLSVQYQSYTFVSNGFAWFIR